MGEMTFKEAVKAGVIVTIIAAVSITIEFNRDKVVAEEPVYVSNELSIPRTRHFAAMEVADIEYIAMTSTSQPEAPKRQSGQSGTTTSVSIHTQAGVLTPSGGVFYGASGRESWYNLPMDGVIAIMRQRGYDEVTYPYWIREDGCKMFGEYIMCAANLEVRPKGTILETSLGRAIVVDTGSFAREDITALDIATNW